jgi:hypothetical protein
MMLVLGFVLQPVMAAHGQLHEILGHLGEGAAHVEGDAHDDAPPSPGEDGHDTGVLHALSHHAHCCAQPQWLAPDGLPLPLRLASASRPPSSGYDAPAESPADTPFRPPIDA